VGFLEITSAGATHREISRPFLSPATILAAVFGLALVLSAVAPLRRR
jgi:hypothetical protein